MNPKNKEKAKSKFKKFLNSATSTSYSADHLNEYSEELNRFNKSKFTDFIYRCDCEYCASGRQKRVLTHKDIVKDQLLDLGEYSET